MKILTNIAKASLTLSLLAVLLSMSSALAQAQALIPSGSFHSVLPEIKGEAVAVDSFYLDSTAVTNKQFAAFLDKNENWRPSLVASVFADKKYLNSWETGNTSNKSVRDEQPVTHISWFAASAYCKWADGRLPTLNEWEYSAQLMDFNSAKDASEFASRLIRWYSNVDSKNILDVGSTGVENQYGVKDQFGLIMEWVQDFKPPVAEDLSLDCGTVGRMQKMGNAYSYAASIRYITRMSFSPRSTTSTMGFRCAYDFETITAQKEISQ